MDVWTPSQERRGLCQEPDTALGQNLSCGILSVSVADFCRRLIDGLSFQRTKPRRLNPTMRPQGPDGSTDLESRSTTSFLGRAWLTDRVTPPARPGLGIVAVGCVGCSRFLVGAGVASAMTS
eukprot:scaffold22692_cov33-Phaeocystis_antarctica.AAC.2